MFIDTHCHLDFPQFDADRDQVVLRARQAGVEKIIVPAVDLESWLRVLALATKYSGVFAAVGVHPNSTAEWQPDWLGELREMAGHPRVVAIGEIGLDYYRDHSPAQVQRRALAAQLDLATELDLPVIIHNREAGKDVISLLAVSPLGGRQRVGVLHSFSGDLRTAEAALEMGFYIGITGPVTFKKADQLRDIVSRLPLDRILVETDAPYLAPQQQRGRRNEPAYVGYVAAQIAELHHVSIDEVARITTANAQRLFGRCAT